MNKGIVFGLLIAVLGGNFLFVAPAYAIHDEKPLCYLIFWRDGRCEDDDDSGSYTPPSTTPTSTNHAPVFTGGQTSFTVNTGNTLQFSVSAFDQDGDAITYGASFLPGGASFDSNSHTFSWTPSNSQAGTYMVQFSAYDGKAYAFQSVTINVNSANNGGNPNTGNRKPVWNTIGTQNAVPNRLIQFTVFATDADGDQITYSALNLPAGAYFDGYTRTFSWTPDEYQLGAHIVTFTAYDQQERADMGVVIPVSKPNNKPVFVSVAPSTGRVSQVYAYDANATDADNDTLTYSVLNGPTGLTMNSATGFVSWVPNSLQTGFSYVQLAVSDGKSQTTQEFYIFVNGPNVVPTPTPQPPINPNPRPAPESPVIFSNIKFENDDGEISVSWNTNIPSGSRVIYDTASQADRVRNFTYANATSDERELVTNHRVVIGKLEPGTVFYLRLVSKTSQQTAVSQEIVFILLENGQINSLFGASLLDILGPLFTNTAFLWLIILALGIALFFIYRKIQKASSPL